MLGAFVQDDVIDRHIHRMVGYGGLHLVGRADQHFRPLESLVHPDDFGAAFCRLTTKLLAWCCDIRVFLLLYRIPDYLLFDLYLAHFYPTLKLAVVAFLECIKQVCRRVHLAVILDLFIALQLDFRAVFQRE